MIVAGRAAVITGAGSGIGRALACDAARRGMRLALIDRGEDGLAETARLADTEDPLCLVVDIRDGDALAEAAARCAERFDDVACLFANAGVLRAGTVATQPSAQWRMMIDVNLAGTIGTVTSFLPLLRASGQAARIVITGSQSSFVARADVCVYSATKQALWAFAEGLKFELDREGAPIGVTFVGPGGVATGIAGAAAGGEGQAQAYLRQALAAHGASPDALAETMLDAVEADRFWVLPNPETKEQLRERVRRVLEEVDPQP